MERYSIKREFEGASVLLTGCTGFIGGLALELLLRTTNVSRIYVLLRPKHGQDPSSRLTALLAGPTFHLLRGRPELLSKVVPVIGSLSAPRLGLSKEDEEAVVENVEFLLHCAADIRLEPPILETLQSNYLGTKNVLDLALAMHKLRSMVHVSTCFVNMNKPRGSTVHEVIYDLGHGERAVDEIAVAEELLAMSSADADRRGEFYRHHWGFPNTYCLGKHLAEALVARTQRAAGLPLAILRPSLVTSVAGLPRPGYCSNWAGPIGMGAAVAVGFFPKLSAMAVHPFSPFDCIPGDLAASAIIATAAALSAGLAPALVAATGAGAHVAPESDPAAAMAAAAAAVTARPTAATAGGAGKKAVVESGAKKGRQLPPVITEAEATAFSDDSAAASPVPCSSPKAATATAAPSPAPLLPLAHPLPRPLLPVAKPPPLLIVQAAISTTYPACAFEAYNNTVEFLHAYGCKASLLVGGVKKLKAMPLDWKPPNEKQLKYWRSYNGAKVKAACCMLKAFGQKRAAKKLAVGFSQWRNNNDFKNDSGLLFAGAVLGLLHDRIEPAERIDYLLTFRPPRAAAAAVTVGGEGAKGEEEPEHPAARLGWRQYIFDSMAGIMRALTGVSVPAKVPNPSRPGEFIEHSFTHVK